MYRVLYRVLRRSILVASAALIVLLNYPEVVGCQIGHRDMEVVASLSKATKQGEVGPSYEFWLPLVGGCGLYYYDSPYRIKGNLGADFVQGGWGRLLPRSSWNSSSTPFVNRGEEKGRGCYRPRPSPSTSSRLA